LDVRQHADRATHGPIAAIPQQELVKWTSASDVVLARFRAGVDNHWAPTVFPPRPTRLGVKSKATRIMHLPALFDYKVRSEHAVNLMNIALETSGEH
jgi:hypothetical protein